MILKDVINFLERRCPSVSAEKWDNVGLLVGDPDAEVHATIVSGDLSRSVIDIAIESKAGLIVVHHPIIFPKSQGLHAVTPSAKHGLVWACLKADLAVYCLHTNFDQWALPALRAVASGLGVEPIGRLFDGDPEAGSNRLFKLVTYVPESHLVTVQEALWDAGAGQIGRYDQCSFSSLGEGTFRGHEGSTPFIGTLGQREQVIERKLEVILPASLQSRVTEALKASHPYEEIAYEYLSVLRPDTTAGLVAGWGYGLIGDWNVSLSLEEVTSRVKPTFSVSAGFLWTPSARVDQGFRRVAFTPGKASSFLGSVIRSGADLWITGEVGYHGASEAAAHGVSVVELGHRESEVFFAPTVKDWLEEAGLNVQGVRHRNQSWIGF